MQMNYKDTGAEISKFRLVELKYILGTTVTKVILNPINFNFYQKLFHILYFYYMSFCCSKLIKGHIEMPTGTF